MWQLPDDVLLEIMDFLQGQVARPATTRRRRADAPHLAPVCRRLHAVWSTHVLDERRRPRPTGAALWVCLAPGAVRPDSFADSCRALWMELACCRALALRRPMPRCQRLTVRTAGGVSAQS